MKIDTSDFHEATREDEIADNVARIKQFLAGDSPHLSTSQQIMVGLALCRPDLLEEAQYPVRQIVEAWKRLNDVQREAIAVWWQS